MASCYYHSRNKASHICRECQRDICDSCVILVEGEPFCQLCWDQQISHIHNLQKVQQEIHREIPWQRWRDIGAIKAFFETAGLVVFQPVLFFSHLPSGKEIASPLIFAVICIMFFWFPMNVFYIKFIFPAALQNFSPEQSASVPSESGQSSADMQQGVVQWMKSISNFEILTMPFNFILSNIFLASLLQHFLITFFRGKEGYIATFQIRCYAMIAQSLLLIPFIGIFLAEFGSLFVCLRGFQVVQKLPFSKALCAALAPIMISFLAFPAIW
ncbi:MAG: YIP1 family protein [Candidatus Omnitrophica bacterium]|nr:YIP1 family protein [Candidatus Omnitrophota bacterium]